MNQYSDKINCILEEGKICKSKMTVIGPTGPRGQIGPTGPTGPTGTLIEAYASKYNNITDTISLLATTNTPVTLNTLGLTSNITGNENNVLVIEQNGIYKIDYFFNGSPSAEANITINVTRNNVTIPSSNITKNISANKYDSFNGSIITNLASDDVIGLNITSSVAATITPQTNTNAYLVITRIN